MKVRIDQITVPKRIRTNLGDLTALAKSMDKHGQLNPITITSKRELIAGERRLEAAKLLGWETVTVNVIKNLNEIERVEIELEENEYRKPFTQEELEDGYKKLAKLKNPSLWRRFINFLKKIFFAIFKRKKKIEEQE